MLMTLNSFSSLEMLSSVNVCVVWFLSSVLIQVPRMT